MDSGVGERDRALFGAWKMINEIACTTEDTTTIRAIIAEAGIEPGAHVGTDPDDFTPSMMADSEGRADG